MEKTREELVEEMIKNIKDQKHDLNLSEVAMPGVYTPINKQIKREEEG